MKKILANRVIRFGATGLIVLTLDLTLVWLLRKWLLPWAAVSLAYFAGVTLHFVLNKFWVFRSGEWRCSGQILRYSISVLACWLCTLWVFTFFHGFIREVLVAKALAVPPTTLLSFVLMRTFVFPPRNNRCFDSPTAVSDAG